MKFRYILPVLLVILLAVAGCTAVAPATGEGAAPEAAVSDVAGEYIPVPREEAVIINETGTFSVFGSYNPFVPSGDTRGMWQAGHEHLFNINWATGEFVYWLADGYSYNDDYTQMTITHTPGSALERWHPLYVA